MMVLGADPINDPRGTGAKRFVNTFDRAVNGGGS